VRTDRPKTDAELRKFGLVMAGPLALLAGVTWWREKAAWPYLAGAALVFLLLGLVAPRSLRVVEKLWMKLAVVMGTVMTYVILILTFFLVFTPMGLVMRALGRRPLPLGFDRQATSYWEPIEAESPYHRAEKPY